ncbi:hypothetical protein SAY86_022510 [Trapa natans]|uniref:RRM domain-containing protein n=1 Tax=Trapa natans TaxID=22666 RepID=A0AAN7LTM9_TRANT|nr:hypothetical protein SAY86_022510 [Trapa natans]
MDGLQATQELEDDSTPEDDPEEIMDNEQEYDLVELEDDLKEEIDNEGKDDNEQEASNVKQEDELDDDIDNKDEDHPEVEEISKGLQGDFKKNELSLKSAGMLKVLEPYKELRKEPNLESPLSCLLEDKSTMSKGSPVRKYSVQAKYLSSETSCGSIASEQDSCKLHFSNASSDGCSLNLERTLSSGKRRRTRWDQLPEGSNDRENLEGDSSIKRRKTRWSSTESQIKLLGPLHLPDFTKETVLASEFDSEMQRVTEELVDIDHKLQKPVIEDERPKEEQSPSPEPLYDNHGFRINTREARVRQKLIQKRQYLISRLIKKQPTFATPEHNKSPKLCKKLYVPVKQYPGYNFAGLIIGPRGNTQKRMEKETGAKISLRGSGSFSRGKHACENDDMHVHIEADNADSLDAASRMVEKLLIPIDDGMNPHKQAQLKELSELKQTFEEQNKFYTCGALEHPSQVGPHHLFSYPCALSDITDIDSTKDNGDIKMSGLSGGKGTLYVSQLPGSVDDHLLKELFCPFGNLIEANKVVGDENDGNSGVCGIVKFKDSNDAAVAASHYNGFRYEGSTLAVESFQSPIHVGLMNQRGTGSPHVNLTVTGQTTWLAAPSGSLLTEHLEGESCLNNGDLFVSNLPDGVDEIRLKELFCSFGRVTEAKMVRDKNTSRSKGCGFVRYEDPKDASMALMHLNGLEVEGRVLTVSWKFPNKTCPPVHLQRSVMIETKLPSPAFADHVGLLPGRPSFTFTPPSCGSSSFDIHRKNSFGSSYTLSDQIPFSTLGNMTRFPGDPDYLSSQVGAYLTTPDDRPSCPLQLIHTPGRPTSWCLSPRTM